jgi:hypothetical protein
MLIVKQSSATASVVILTIYGVMQITGNEILQGCQPSIIGIQV